jgi:transposase
MIQLPANVWVYLCLTACDMRKSFDSYMRWCGNIWSWMRSPDIGFVFAGRRRDRVKILYWNRDGFAIWSKRLEEGTYAIPQGGNAEERRREIAAEELGALLSGIDLSRATRRKRYQRTGQ